MDEKRTVPRIRALMPARIVLKNGASTMNCMVKNLSETGAKLVADNFMSVPDSFDLLMDNGHRRHCSVRWRKLKELGVEFG